MEIRSKDITLVKRTDVIDYLLDQVNNGRPLDEQLKRLITKLYYEQENDSHRTINGQ